MVEQMPAQCGSEATQHGGPPPAGSSEISLGKRQQPSWVLEDEMKLLTATAAVSHAVTLQQGSHEQM